MKFPFFGNRSNNFAPLTNRDERGFNVSREIPHFESNRPQSPFVKGGSNRPLRGAYCELTELTGAHFAASEWLLQQRQRATQQLAGRMRTALRGRGLEFEEVRGYQPGDDVRTIDWRVTARSGRTFTKLFREEREKPLLLVVDQRQPMFFGSRHCFKSKIAAYIGALLAWSGLEQGDRVGGLLIGNQERREIRPRRTRKSAMLWLNTLLNFNRALRRDTQLSSAKQSLSLALTELRRIARPGSTIYLISDFAGAEHETIRDQLFALARRCEVVALFVFDPLEIELPPPALYTVTDGQRRFTLDSGDAQLRSKHRNAFIQHRDYVRQQLLSLGIPLLEISTDLPPLQQLASLRKRAS